MKRIAVYSGTGGVGKSFIAANMASSLFQRGIRVVLCELSTNSLMSMHFGGSLLTDDLGEHDKGSVRMKSNVPPIYDNHQFHSHVLHNDFILLTASSGSGQGIEERLTSAMQYADRMQGMGGLMILDIPTNMQLARSELIFDVELEIVAADPVSVAAACRHHETKKSFESRSGSAHEHYVVINKKDLRLDLSQDAASVAELFFGDSILSCIHYDSAVPESFTHKSLLNDYAPHSQAGMEINELSRTVADLLEPGDSEGKDLA